MKKVVKELSVSNTVLTTWFERDRAHVCLSWRSKKYGIGETIVEWWDDAVNEAVADGFLDPKGYHRSALAYAREYVPSGQSASIRALPTDEQT